MQVFSRLWVLWGLINLAPEQTTARGLSLGLPALQLNLATLLTAWSLSEVLRYSLYAFKARAWPRWVCRVRCPGCSKSCGGRRWPLCPVLHASTARLVIGRV